MGREDLAETEPIWSKADPEHVGWSQMRTAEQGCPGGAAQVPPSGRPPRFPVSSSPRVPAAARDTGLPAERGAGRDRHEKRGTSSQQGPGAQRQRERGPQAPESRCDAQPAVSVPGEAAVEPSPQAESHVTGSPDTERGPWPPGAPFTGVAGRKAESSLGLCIAPCAPAPRERGRPVRAQRSGRARGRVEDPESGESACGAGSAQQGDMSAEVARRAPAPD